ncbi:fatty acid CoA ligase FadD9 [Williamsia sterculiae]|uniref:Fatty acid CoA ligase FadD9 n=2 Tax=Williamsia sterculiae TaxID=1344003 RepID=A0A1N7EPZ8_9NOCA|nr:fatty acid CoA ligase FadD9 [Williamsia sterculiae]
MVPGSLLPASAIDTAGADPAVVERVSAETSVSGIVSVLADGYGDRAAMAWRPGNARAWRTLTYAQLASRVDAVATSLVTRFGLGQGDTVAILGFTSPGYSIVDLAVTGPAGGVSVPLQTGASPSSWQQILEETAPRVLAVAAEHLPAVTGILAAMRRTTVEHLLIFDTEDVDVDDLDRRRREIEGTVAQLTTTLHDDLTHDVVAPVRRDRDPDALALLIYTSGSTGTPKGAMYRQSAVARMLRNGFGLAFSRDDPLRWVTLNFMPMSHVMGRTTLLQTLGNGGTAFFTAQSDLSQLLDDLAEVHPTQLQFVPRVWEMLYREYLADRARGADDATALSDLRTRYLGAGEVRAVTGSAPISPDVATFVGDLLGEPLIEGYGSTESGGVLLNGHITRPPVIAYRLRDVPELGYRSTDRPHPRGELLVKTTDIFAGYYRRPELTAEAFDEDGFYRTGDIVAEIAPDELRYLDRRNNVIKLSQGEFVTVSHAEAALVAPPVEQIYVYGNSSRPYLLAVVVPTAGAVVDAGGDDDILRARVNTALRDIGRDAGLSAVEIPREVIIERDPFSQHNGLLTNTAKLARPALKARYGNALEALYGELEAGRDDKLRLAREQASERPAEQTVIDVATALLDLAEGDIGPQSHFTDLGGDSLTAVTLGTELREIFDVEVPVGVITSPTTDMSGLAAFVAAPGGQRPTAASIHGDGETIRATDLTLDAFLDPSTIARASDLPPAPGEPRTVLVTGATGFLGRYLALDWLRRMDMSGGTVICLVRASDADAGRIRLDDAFDTGDDELLAEYHRLAGRHLRVVVADKSARHLGLDDDTWQELAETVDLIVDPAALVNHVLPYHELFGPNVVGTAELIELALTECVKPYVYVSTVGVATQIAPAEFVEDADIREISATRRLDHGYASGYGNSKWAGEVLLREAHEHLSLPVTVFRCDMILADDHDLGQLNLPDMFTRLLMSVLATGLAPRSFHELGPDGSPIPSHYDALPVDFLAAAINALVDDDGFSTYHAMNPHEDGVGLDRYVDWLIDDGAEITRVDDYDEWFTRFGEAITNLPDTQRRHSLLPLLDNYARPTSAVIGGIAPADRFRDAVRRAKVGRHKDIPHITPGIIANYARGLRHLGLT